MLTFGDFDVLRFNKNTIVWNLSSLREGFQRINIMPPLQVVRTDDKDYDIQYMQWILSNDLIFYEFMDKIIIPLYKGIDVFILIKRDTYYDGITDSLIKLIQQRYGYISNILNVPDDWDYINSYASFNIFGLNNLDIDKERYLSIRWSMYGDEGSK